MLTRRGRILLVTVALLAGLLGGLTAHLWNPWAAPAQEVQIFEDGSGILWEGTVQVLTYDEGTFVWDCDTMGNRVCGDVDDGHIQEVR